MPDIPIPLDQPPPREAGLYFYCGELVTVEKFHDDLLVKHINRKAWWNIEIYNLPRWSARIILQEPTP